MGREQGFSRNPDLERTENALGLRAVERLSERVIDSFETDIEKDYVRQAIGMLRAVLEEESLRLPERRGRFSRLLNRPTPLEKFLIAEHTRDVQQQQETKSRLEQEQKTAAERQQREKQEAVRRRELAEIEKGMLLTEEGSIASEFDYRIFKPDEGLQFRGKKGKVQTIHPVESPSLWGGWVGEESISLTVSKRDYGAKETTGITTASYDSVTGEFIRLDVRRKQIIQDGNGNNPYYVTEDSYLVPSNYSSHYRGAIIGFFHTISEDQRYVRLRKSEYGNDIEVTEMEVVQK